MTDLDQINAALAAQAAWLRKAAQAKSVRPRDLRQLADNLGAIQVTLAQAYARIQFALKTATDAGTAKDKAITDLGTQLKTLQETDAANAPVIAQILSDATSLPDPPTA